MSEVLEMMWSIPVRDVRGPGKASCSPLRGHSTYCLVPEFNYKVYFDKISEAKLYLEVPLIGRFQYGAASR